MSTKPKPISKTISFSIARVGTAHSYRAGKLLSDIGLYLGQEMVLQYLWQEDKLTQSQLAHKIGVQLQTIHKMIRRMEKAGLVTKHADEQDLRVSRVHLTPKGRELQTVTEDVWEQLEQETLADLTVEEKYILRRLLHKLEENLWQE
ncbi:MAG: MarR family transcriptional regulator [Anaerolineae bacterium]|nr:MarR family transcriptional regulator [Anaerolineae bacterium]